MRKLTRKDGNKFVRSIMGYAFWCATWVSMIALVAFGIIFSNALIIVFALIGFGISLYQNFKFYRKIADHYSDLCNTGVYDE